MKKINRFALWTAIIYTTAVLFIGVFSIGDAVLASSAIKGLFFVAIIPFIIFSLTINFFAGYGVGLILEKIWRKIK